LATEILTILFRPLKPHRIGELLKSMGGLTL
jgi:hypothetical protein